MKKVDMNGNSGRLSDLKNRSEKVTGGQIPRILKTNSYSIGRKSREV